MSKSLSELKKDEEIIQGFVKAMSEGDSDAAFKCAQLISKRKITVRFEVDAEHKPQMVPVPMKDALLYSLYKKIAISGEEKQQRRKELKEKHNIPDKIVKMVKDQIEKAFTHDFGEWNDLLAFCHSEIVKSSK